MKKLTLLTLSLLIGHQAFACDSYLKFSSPIDARKTWMFAKDCTFQDRFAAVKDFFTANKINVSDIAEYRVIRFIERAKWETAKKSQTPPEKIYDPAPITWNVWDGGIRVLFSNEYVPFLLRTSGGFENGYSDYKYLNFDNINRLLLTNGRDNISRDALAHVNVRDSAPGTFRDARDGIIGYTASASVASETQKIQLSQGSMMRFQHRWENAYGVPFSAVVEQFHGANPSQARLSVDMSVQANATNPNICFVGYSQSASVGDSVSWLNTFVNANFDRYYQSKPVLPPTEFAAAVQKWFVTIHPFSDGNGRTSRAIEDFILSSFKLPYAPGGDLQNDAMEDYDTYINNTYIKMDAMLTKLESCVDQYKAGHVSFECRTVQDLNHP